MNQLSLFSPEADSFPPPRKLDPILKWAGGKKWAIPHVGPGIWAKLQKTRGRYFEPFLGGGALGFWLGLPNMVLADRCEPLMDFYRALAKCPAEVAYVLSGLAVEGVDEASFYKVRNWRPKKLPQKAARVLYLNKLCYNGLWRENQKGENNVPYDGTKYRKSVTGRKSSDAITTLFPHKGKLEALGGMLAQCELRADDFDRVLEDVCEGDVVLADPPYHAGFSAYTKEGFDDEDQKDLASTLYYKVHERGATLVAFNHDNDFVREIYSWAPVLMSSAEARAINSDVRGRGRKGCLIITNEEGLIGG